MGKTTAPCPQCRTFRRRLSALEEELAAERAEVVRLRKQLAAARKDSSTSSKPPSSDIVKPPPPAPPPGQDQRQRGGQPGHHKHERALFPPEALTAPPHCHTIDICPDCGHGLQPAALEARVVLRI